MPPKNSLFEVLTPLAPPAPHKEAWKRSILFVTILLSIPTLSALVSVRVEHEFPARTRGWTRVIGGSGYSSVPGRSRGTSLPTGKTARRCPTRQRSKSDAYGNHATGSTGSASNTAAASDEPRPAPRPMGMLSAAALHAPAQAELIRQIGRLHDQVVAMCTSDWSAISFHAPE